MGKLKDILSALQITKKKDVLPLKTIFDKFRQLLEHNNRVLELIADMGDKLSGDYLFDKQYIHAICRELDEEVYKVIYNLNLISHKKYLKLFDLFEKIKINIKAELDSKSFIPKGDYIIALKEITTDIVDRVGGKMATLGELKNRLGMKVPEGFAFSTAAYKRFMEYNHLDTMLEKLSNKISSQSRKDVDEASDTIKGLILKGKMPPDLKKDFKKHLSALKKKNKRELKFAVRSSALEEDGEVSFAGQYESILNVPQAELLSAYKKVLASFFAPRVIAYREEQKNLPKPNAMAVGCMEMVPSVSSGVLYTLNPSTPQKDAMVVSASWGLGKMVVEGEGMVDQCELSKEVPYKVVFKKIAKKDKMYDSAPQGDIRLIDVPEENRLSRALVMMIWPAWPKRLLRLRII
jgi:Phosphoenolpyruvate synthase/pyruvate phosphate dikinase